jgi:hypothetical protein
MTENILLGILGGGNLILFIKFLIERHDRKKEREEDQGIANIKKRLDKLEKDGLRMQMLFLITLKPKETKEILTVAEYYFTVLKGDWYMTSIFKKWIAASGTGKPEWFDDNSSTD